MEKKNLTIFLVIGVVVVALIIIVSVSNTTVESEQEFLPVSEDTEKSVLVESVQDFEEPELEIVDLTQMSFVSGFQEAGELMFNISVSNNKLTLGGEVYQKGIGTHAASEYQYDIGGNYKEFRAKVGIDDNSSGCGDGAIFVVNGDGEELYRSEVMKHGESGQDINVSIIGINTLSLITDERDNNQCDHVNWVNPILIP